MSSQTLMKSFTGRRAGLTPVRSGWSRAPKLWFAPPGVCWVTRCGAGVDIAEKRAKVNPLNQLPSAGIGRQRDTVHMVMHVSTKRVTQIKSEVQEVVHPRLRRGEGGWGRGAARGGR